MLGLHPRQRGRKNERGGRGYKSHFQQQAEMKRGCRRKGKVGEELIPRLDPPTEMKTG